jgi:hypothetical protein
VALTILGVLFVAQLRPLIGGDGSDDEALGRLLVTGALTALLALAAFAQKRLHRP